MCVDFTNTDSNVRSGQVAPESESYHTVHVNKAASTALLRSGETNLFSRMKITPKNVSESSSMTNEPTDYMKSSISSLCAEYSSKTTHERPSSHDIQSSYDKQSKAPSRMLPPPRKREKT